MKKITMIMLLALPGFVKAQGAMGEVVGTVLAAKDSSIVYGARVQTESNGTFYRAKTDLDGRFRISGIPAGQYLFSIILGTDTLRDILADVPIEGIENIGNRYLGKSSTMMDDVDVIWVKDQMHLKYGVASEVKISAEDVKRSPVKFNVKAMIAAATTDVRMTDDGELVFRGARKGDMIYMIDGVKTSSVANIPSAAIGGMMIYSGGIPAKYGDTTGGVVIMESKGYFDLYRAWEADQRKNK
jgi:hypothetical protein